MSENQRLFHCTPGAVFRVLGNGWLFPTWVVGATRMRKVDEHWPAEGAMLHHSFGTWPLVIDDTTTVLTFVPDQLLLVRAKGWPAGEADVLIEATPAPGGCVVTIYEDAVKGPGTMIPGFLRHPVLRWRNSETLRRLAFIAEGQSGRSTPEAED
ncbi:MAG: SRPBCC family protein [Nakamurella sp.]